MTTEQAVVLQQQWCLRYTNAMDDTLPQPAWFARALLAPCEQRRSVGLRDVVSDQHPVADLGTFSALSHMAPCLPTLFCLEAACEHGVVHA